MRKYLIVILIVLAMVSCRSPIPEVVSNEEDVESVFIELQNMSELEDAIYYSFIITNESSRLIKYIELDVGFKPTVAGKDIGLKNDTIYSAFCAEPFDIDRGESKAFQVHIPLKTIADGMVDFQDIEVRVTGYFDEIGINNRFGFMGPLEYYETIKGSGNAKVE